MIRLLLAALALLATPAAAEDRPAEDKAAAIARAAGFEGTLLVGHPDGTADVATLPGSGPPLAADAVWRWASITKQLAAVIAMQEVAAGRLDLDAPVARYWPGWQAPAAATIRIRDLLGHTSRLPDPDSSPPDARGIPAFYGSAVAPPDKAAAGFCAGPPRAADAPAFLYNNCDTLVLAEVLRRTTARPFDRLARERLARPTGMQRFGLYRFGSRRPAHVHPTGTDADIDALLDLGLYGASAGAYGTIRDLWRFDRALMAGDLLPESARATMWAGDPKLGYAAFGQWAWPLKLARCGRTVTVVERQGLVGGIELRNFLLPDQQRALILFARRKPAGYGAPWEGKGLAHDLLEEVGCR